MILTCIIIFLLYKVVLNINHSHAVTNEPKSLGFIDSILSSEVDILQEPYHIYLGHNICSHGNEAQSSADAGTFCPVIRTRSPSHSCADHNPAPRLGPDLVKPQGLGHLDPFRSQEKPGKQRELLAPLCPNQL